MSVTLELALIYINNDIVDSMKSTCRTTMKQIASYFNLTPSADIVPTLNNSSAVIKMFESKDYAYATLRMKYQGIRTIISSMPELSQNISEVAQIAYVERFIELTRLQNEDIRIRSAEKKRMSKLLPQPTPVIQSSYQEERLLSSVFSSTSPPSPTWLKYLSLIPESERTYGRAASDIQLRNAMIAYIDKDIDTTHPNIHSDTQRS
jgi:hypothetical protein